jgi:DNA repair exonuclease SbcCD ATPase subunit
MRLASTVLHKVGPFDHLELDFESMPGPLVALVAPIGTGKTFTVESSYFGAFFREMPTQDSLLARAWARDSYSQQTFVNGTRQTFRHLLDGIAKKGESMVLGEDGLPLWESTKVSDFDAWAKTHLPDKDVIRATTFTVQKSDGFIDLSSAERIQVILEATGVARIERAAVEGRKEVARLERDLAALRVRIADANASAPDLDAATAELAAAREASTLADARAATMRQYLAAAEAQAVEVAEIERQAAAARATRDRLEGERLAATERVNDLCRRYEAADPRGALAVAEEAERALSAARAALAAAETTSREADAARAAAVAAHDARAKLEGDVDAARAAASLLAARVDKGRSFIDRAEAIRAAGPRLTAARAELAALDARIAESVSVGGRLLRSAAEATSRLAGIDSRIARARETVQGREAAEHAAAALPAAEVAAATAGAAVEAAESAERALQGQHVADVGERLGGLRRCVDGSIQAIENGRAPFALGMLRAARDGDAAAEGLAEELPGKLRCAETAVYAARDRRRAADQALVEARSAEARLAAIRAAAEDLAAAEAERAAILDQGVERDAEAKRLLDGERAARPAAEALRAEIQKLEADAADLEKLAQAEAAAEERRGQLRAAEETLERLRADLAALPPAAELPPPGAGTTAESAALTAAEAAARAAAVAVGSAEATRRELEPQVRAVREALESVTRAIAEAPAIPETPSRPVDVARARAEAESDERVARGLAADLARAAQLFEQATAAAARVVALTAERSAVEVELADWSRLVIDCVKIRSAEVDNVGPEFTAIVNDLLKSCHGNRYTVRITTKRPKADGKGETDECQVMVIDSVDGTEKEARKHSGGERENLGEALALGLTILACGRAGVEGITLVRDESAGGQDEASARVYVAMLRRAAAILKADKILIISHSPEVQALCDHRIELPRKAAA